MKTLILFITMSLSVVATAEPTVIHNIKGYTLTGSAGNQAQLTSFDALVFEHGKVLFAGSLEEAKRQFSDAQWLDGQGGRIYPNRMAIDAA
jgi:hypothetical protein